MAVLLAIAPLRWGMLIVVGGIVIVMALLEPLAALSLALLLGPARALLGAVWPGTPLHPGQVLFGLFVLVWCVRALYLRKMRLVLPAFALPLLVYVGVCTLSLWGAADLVSGIGELIKWLQMLVIALLVFDCCQRRHVGWVFAAALASGVLQAAIGLWEFGLRGSGPGAFEVAPGIYRAYGTFEQPNPFGGFMGMTWPLAAGLFMGLFSAARRDRTEMSRTVLTMLVFVAAALTLGGMVVSYSRGAWAGALAAILVMGLVWPRRRGLGIAMFMVGMLAVFGVARIGALPVGVSERLAAVAEFGRVQDVSGATIDPANFSLIERMAHWQAASRMAAARPWLGVGLGNFQVAYPDYRLLNWEQALGHAHNVYLNVVAESGLLGLVSYLLLWGSVFVITLRAIGCNVGWRRGAALGMLGVWTHLAVHNMVDYLFVNNVHLYLGALLGVLSVIAKRTGTEISFSSNLNSSQATG
ncbi:MAG: O-antigen ligase family protein [Anaerolineales bacterium]|nr:O-antigen ligase family protein [Anaerolineales bacterium]